MNHAGSAAAQNRKTGRKAFHVRMRELREDAERGIAYFLKQRPSGCCQELRQRGLFKAH